MPRKTSYADPNEVEDTINYCLKRFDMSMNQLSLKLGKNMNYISNLAVSGYTISDRIWEDLRWELIYIDERGEQ